MTATRRRGVEALAGVAWLALVVVLVVFVPIWVSWVLASIACTVGTAAGFAVNRHEPLRFVWRMRADQAPRVLTAAEGIAWNCLVGAGLLVATAIATVGVGRGGRLAATMPLTIGLGSAAAWAMAIAFALWVGLHLARPAWLARHDPARPQPVVLTFGSPEELPSGSARRLRRHGFRTTEAREASDGGQAIRVELDHTAPARLASSDDSPPRQVRVRPAALLEAATLAELRRADTRLRRAGLIEGLRRLLELAATRRFDRGSGFWIAPHLWYVIGMTRDEDDGDFWTIGPHYHKVFPLAARQHLHQVLRALEVDLLFLEDGVAFEDFEAVLARLFDVYDVLGPEPVEEKDFVGLVRVRVMIHEQTLGEPLDREGYPEPSYDEIGRARILHIMKDRGDGDEERDPRPIAPERQPVLAPTG